MATLTTVEDPHTQIDFDPSGILSVRSYDIDTRAPVTTVYGDVGTVHVGDSPVTFLARFGLTVAFLQLTAPDGWAFWLKAAAVSVLSPPPAENYVATVQTIVTAGGRPFAVRETRDTIKALLLARGVNL